MISHLSKLVVCGNASYPSHLENPPFAAIILTKTILSILPLAIINCSVNVISTLIWFYPEAAADRDIFGRLPIHYACANGASVDTIKDLLAANPCAASARDNQRWLPIHVACHFGASTEIIRALVNSYPDGINNETERGSTPMRLICRIECKNKEEIKEILKVGAQNHYHDEAKKPYLIHDFTRAHTGLHHRPIHNNASVQFAQ